MARTRKGWAQLSVGYRARLTRAGITPAQYRAGVSLQKARGHAVAPESTRFRRRIRSGSVSIKTYIPDFDTLPPATQERVGRLFYEGFLSKGKGRPGEGGKRYRSAAQHEAQVDFLNYFENEYRAWVPGEDWQRFRFEYQLSFSSAA